MLGKRRQATLKKRVLLRLSMVCASCKQRYKVKNKKVCGVCVCVCVCVCGVQGIRAATSELLRRVVFMLIAYCLFGQHTLPPPPCCL